VRAALAAAATVLGLLAAPASAAARVPVVSDGFTISGVAGSQAVIRLARPLGPPGVLGQGPAVTFSASSGDLAGLAILGASRYDVVMRALPRYVCGKADCGPESYDTSTDTNVPQGERLPAGEYRVVLIGSPGARVTATVPSSSRSVRPVAVRPTATTKAEVAPTFDVGGMADGLEQQEQGSWKRLQTHRRALVGVVHVVEIRYGNAVSHNGSCPGHATVGNAALKSRSQPAPVGVGIAWTPMYAAYVTACASAGVEQDVTASWQGRVDAAEARQRGLAFYVPLA
jgi:hypothetical protein